MDDVELRKAQIRLLNERLKAVEPELMEVQVLSAKLVYNYFKCLVEAGFEKKEAIAIVKVHGYSPPAPGETGGKNDEEEII